MNKPSDRIHHSWDSLKYLLNTDILLELKNEVIPNKIVYPKTMDVFKVFSIPLNKVKVVVLGQDPYHGAGQATGLAFSVNESVPIPPSLRIIQEEISQSIPSMDIELENLLMEEKEWKTLQHWHNQGVFLLNTALTVESGNPGSHLKYWEYFTKSVISFLSTEKNVIWLLWGAKARSYIPYIANPFIVDKYNDDTIKQIPDVPKNYILTASHPASEVYKKNAGFFGCNHFKYANQILKIKKQNIINW